MYKKSFVVKKEQTKTNIHIPFQIEEEYDFIKVYLQYEPDGEEDLEKCVPEIRQALEKYYAGEVCGDLEQKSRQMGTIKNLITLSLECNGTYIGNAHRKDRNQCHIISKTEAARGFISPSRLKGEWCATIHLHMVFTEHCDITFAVEGGRYDEVPTI